MPVQNTFLSETAGLFVLADLIIQRTFFNPHRAFLCNRSTPTPWSMMMYEGLRMLFLAELACTSYTYTSATDIERRYEELKHIFFNMTIGIYYTE